MTRLSETLERTSFSGKQIPHCFLSPQPSDSFFLDLEMPPQVVNTHYHSPTTFILNTIRLYFIRPAFCLSRTKRLSWTGFSFGHRNLLLLYQPPSYLSTSNLISKVPASYSQNRPHRLEEYRPEDRSREPLHSLSTPTVYHLLTSCQSITISHLMTVTLYQLSTYLMASHIEYERCSTVNPVRKVSLNLVILFIPFF